MNSSKGSPTVGKALSGAERGKPPVHSSAVHRGGGSDKAMHSSEAGLKGLANQKPKSHGDAYGRDGGSMLKSKLATTVTRTKVSNKELHRNTQD